MDDNDDDDDGFRKQKSTIVMRDGWMERQTGVEEEGLYFL